MEDSVFIEYFGVVPNYIGIAAQTFAALIFGGLIGYDREKKAKAAGLKTHMLICLGACIFTLIGILINKSYGGDPSRVAAQIVSGIGFLGAGTILRGNGTIYGLTSAATIWLVAAIGFAVGAGYIFTAGSFTLTIFIVLSLINPIYNFLNISSDFRLYQIDVYSTKSVARSLSAIILSQDVELDDIIEEEKDGSEELLISSVFLKAQRKQIEKIVEDLRILVRVENVTYRALQGKINKDISIYKRP